MRISERSAYALEDVIWSHLAADGRPLHEIERTEPHLIDALREIQEAIPAVRNRPRRRGRPDRGCLCFHKKRIMELQSEMTIIMAATILGCCPTTVYHWCLPEDGLRHRRKGSLIIIQAQDLLDFLTVTGRFRPDEE